MQCRDIFLNDIKKLKLIHYEIRLSATISGQCSCCRDERESIIILKCR